MKIKSLQLQNFKRFSDLTLQDIPNNTKLVLLIGSNGSGKSSVFDAFDVLGSKQDYLNIEELKKDLKNTQSPSIYLWLDNDVQLSVGLIDSNTRRQSSNINNYSKNSFYGRTAFRQTTRLTRINLGGNFEISTNADKPKSFIDKDERFENDIEVLIGDVLKDVFRDNKGIKNTKNKVIEPINEALIRIFGSSDSNQLHIVDLIPPLDGKVMQINFKKGTSEFHYDLLSAGEKQVINVLLNLVARKEYYQDTIYFFDEIDLHLNTQLQYNLLKEIVENWIPENCQFWTASHSLGFIQYATDFQNGVIFDFDDLDFDQPQTIVPKEKNDTEVFEIAVTKSFIDFIVQGKKIIFSENTDTSFYNDLKLKDILFFEANDKNDVFHKSKNTNYFGLIDRDYLTDDEMLQIKNVYPLLYVLPYYTFENMLYHPDNLKEYYTSVNRPFNQQSYIDKIVELKNKERDFITAGIIQARSGYPFFKENENNKILKKFKENYKPIIDLIKSDDFETFYKLLNAKEYGKNIIERQNLSKIELTKTSWFKNQIENIIN